MTRKLSQETIKISLYSIIHKKLYKMINLGAKIVFFKRKNCRKKEKPHQSGKPNIITKIFA